MPAITSVDLAYYEGALSAMARFLQEAATAARVKVPAGIARSVLRLLRDLQEGKPFGAPVRSQIAPADRGASQINLMAKRFWPTTSKTTPEANLMAKRIHYVELFLAGEVQLDPKNRKDIEEFQKWLVELQYRARQSAQAETASRERWQAGLVV